ncbi:hypothetical protein BT96DRAFT_920346 [Gymnopus androsaceus JB14]|uniref:Uncharacterized protein n=1 Tax=Gymnopus androsaceus JB14 TaxID=1447944 RepID=A0A6A4HM28_9AGAR|nr:hypothetical protein BT96DRAFT_920346 [Gymnopus androsaceus JB14]
MSFSEELPSSPPRLPSEIIQLIVHEAWALPLTTSERARFAKSSLAVSLSWMSFFARESCIDVHLLSDEHTKYWYKPIVSGSSTAYFTIAGLDDSTVRRLCRSITFHCIEPPRAAHPRNPICVTTFDISDIVRNGGFDNFEGIVAIQFPLTVMKFTAFAEKDVKWRSLYDTYEVLVTPEFWKLQISGVKLMHLCDVLEKLTQLRDGIQICRWW